MLTFPVGLMNQSSQVDPYLANVLLYLKGDNFTDSSSYNRTVTTFAGSAISTDRKYGSGSFDFTGSNSHIEIPSGGVPLTNTTIEYWIKAPYISNVGIFGIGTNPQNNVSNVIFNGSLSIWGSNIVGTISNYINNSWTHIALTFNSNNQINCYINGVLRGTITKVSPSWDNPITIGRYTSNSIYRIYGNIDSFRITSGIRYTTNFNCETDTYLAY